MSIEDVIKNTMRSLSDKLKSGLDADSWYTKKSERQKRTPANRDIGYSETTVQIIGGNYEKATLSRRQRQEIEAVLEREIEEHIHAGCCHRDVKVRASSKTLICYFSTMQCARPENGPKLFFSNTVKCIKDMPEFKAGTIFTISLDEKNDLIMVSQIDETKFPIPNPWPADSMVKCDDQDTPFGIKPAINKPKEWE